jgi:hypothetical protein
VPTDVVRRVQGPVLGAGDQHGLARDVDGDHPFRSGQAEVVDAADAVPLADPAFKTAAIEFLASLNEPATVAV